MSKNKNDLAKILATYGPPCEFVDDYICPHTHNYETECQWKTKEKNYIKCWNEFTEIESKRIEN